MKYFPTPYRCVPSVTKKSLMLHSFAFAWSCVGIYCDRNYYITSRLNDYGGRFQYLTLINAYTCFFAYAFAVIVDLLQVTTHWLEEDKITKDGCQLHQSILISIRDHLISFWVSTLSIHVCVMYWSIAAIDAESIHPKDKQDILPMFGWYNQYLHTLPIFVLLALITNVNYGYGSFKKSVLSTLALGCSYFTWIVYLAKMNGYWVYPFMAKQTKVEFYIFCIFSHFVFFGISTIARKVSSSVWSSEYKEKVATEFGQKGE